MSVRETLRLKKMIKRIKDSGLFDEEYYFKQLEEIPTDRNYIKHYLMEGANALKNPSSMFNTRYYLKHNSDVQSNGMNPLWHYILYGKAEGRKACEGSHKETYSIYETWCHKREALKGSKRLFLFNIIHTIEILRSKEFDGNWYIENYPTVGRYLRAKPLWKYRYKKNPILKFIGRISTTAAAHYVFKGMYEGKNPNSNFSTEYYMNNNSDLIHGRWLNPFVHYLKYGRKEQRACHSETSTVTNFDNEYKALDRDELASEKNVTIIVKCNNDIEFKEITESIEYANCEILKRNKPLKDMIKEAQGELIWIIDSKDISLDCGFLNQATKFFADESIFAVVAEDIEGRERIKSYKDIYTPEKIFKVDYRSKVLFKNPKATKWFNEYKFSIDSREDFNLFFYHLIIGSKVAFIEQKCVVVNEQDALALSHIHRFVELYLRKYASSLEDKVSFYELIKSKLIIENPEAFKQLVATYKLEEVLREEVKPKILIGIYDFTHGGGEIMPIRLANCLYDMGYVVGVYCYTHGQTEKLVRQMLNDYIPVIEAKTNMGMAYHIEKLGYDVISTHHQAVQSFMAGVMSEYGHLNARVLNVGTSHGMYENFKDSILDCMFKDSALMKYTDYWTYVADKNKVPFKKFNVYDEEKFIKIPNGMERPVLNPVSLDEYGIPKDAFVVTVVSRALKEKGWLHAIEAVKMVRNKTNKNIHLLLIGNGEVYDEYANKLGNEFIHFLGFRDNPCDYFGVSDLCMLPSYYPSESAPLCIIEAMMCGIPVLASDIGDVKEMLSYDGELAGSVFKLHNMQVDNDVLAEKLEALVMDNELYTHAKEIAIKKSAKFEIKYVCEKYLEVFSAYKNKAAVVSKEDNEDKINRVIKKTRLLYEGMDETSSPKVTVIVPNYNHEKYLRERLDSIYHQTYQNFTVLLMDDCSSDNSREILEEYAKRYPEKTTLLFNEKNSGGVFYQWTKGILNAKTDLCWIAESDDSCALDFLENTIVAFEDKAVNISYAQYEFINEKGEIAENAFLNYVGSIDDKKWRENYINDAGDEVETGLGIKNTIPNASGAVFRNPGHIKLFDNEQWYKMKICGDWILYLHLLMEGKVAYTVDTRSYFRFHSNNSSAKTYRNDTYYLEHEYVAREIRRLYNVNDDTIKKQCEFVKAFYKGHVHSNGNGFDSVYNLEKILKESYPLIQPDVSELIIRQKERVLIEDVSYETVVVNPIKGLTDREGEALPLDSAMAYSGNNSGNMVFVDAVKEQTEHTHEIWYDGNKLKQINDKHKVTAILPSSNFIIYTKNKAHSERILNTYKNNNIPITMDGLGAQLSKVHPTPKQLVAALPEEVKNMFKTAASNAVSLGVRGEITAECLELMGIKNYRIIGCPTCYKYLDGVYKELKAPTTEKMLFTVTAKSKEETRLLEFAMKHKATWIMQMATEHPELMYDLPVDEKAIYRDFPELSLSIDELRDYMKHHAKIFFSMKEWNTFLQEEGFTFSFGSRFHGNMNALRNGIPALWITHDSRTSELINVLKLPHISLTDFQEIKDPQELLEYCDYSEFYSNYGRLTREYVKYLDENHIKHKFKVN